MSHRHLGPCVENKVAKNTERVLRYDDTGTQQ